MNIKKYKVKSGNFQFYKGGLKDLKKQINYVPEIKCPNPQCVVNTVPDHPGGKDKSYKTLFRPVIYLDQTQQYFCPECEMVYPYNDIINKDSNEQSYNLDEHNAIEYPRSTPNNPVNKVLKDHNVFIQTFGKIEYEFKQKLGYQKRNVNNKQQELDKY